MTIQEYHEEFPDCAECGSQELGAIRGHMEMDAEDNRD